MKTMLSKSGHSLFSDTTVVKSINAILLLAGRRCRPLPLNGASLTCHHIHIGPGVLKKGHDSAWHVHDEVQIEYAVSGRFRFQTRAGEQCLKPGEGIVIPRRMEHSFRTLRDGVLVGVLVDVDGPRGQEFSEHLEQCARGRFLLFASEEGSVWIDQIFHMVVTGDNRPWEGEMAGGLLQLWLAKSLGEAVDMKGWALPVEGAAPPGDAQRRALCDRALRFMRANCTGRIAPRDIAEQVGISPRHLARLFRHVRGDTVNSTLIRMRLEKAYAMLSNEPSLLVKQVAIATGFSNAAYFTYCFKRAFHCLPKDVRGSGDM